MSFFTGLVTGAATSISGNLQAALDRRENEMSKARAYMRTRQAQKLELAEAHDKRASKALNRFINEFDGNVAKGLAAYKAVGGDVDAAEAYITELDGTRAVGLDYDINEKFKFDNIDLGQFTDLSRSDAASSIGMSTTGVGASAFKDTSGLSKIGLGLKNTQGMADEINKLIPPRTSQAIDGLESATFDPTGTKSATQFQMTKQKFEQQMKTGSLDLKNQIKFNILEMGKLGDGPEDEETRLRLLRDNEALTRTYARFQEIDNTGKGGLTANTLIGLYNSGLKNLRDKYQYSSKGGVAYLIDDDGNAKTGQDAINRWTEVRTQFQVDYTVNSLMNRDGTFKNTMTEDIPFHLQFGTSIAEQAIASFNTQTNNDNTNATPEIDTSGLSSVDSVANQTNLYTENSTDTKKDSTSSASVNFSEAETNKLLSSDDEDLEFFQTGMEAGLSKTLIKGNTAKEFGENYMQYVMNNPVDYIDGFVQKHGSDGFIEDLQNHKLYLDTAGSGIKDKERKEEYERKVEEAIRNIPKQMATVLRSGTVGNIVMSLPENYRPVYAEKLLSEEGGFSGNYLYTDENGAQTISPVLPSKFGLEVK